MQLMKNKARYSKLFDIGEYSEPVVSQVYLQEESCQVNIFNGRLKSEQAPFNFKWPMGV